MSDALCRPVEPSEPPGTRLRQIYESTPYLSLKHSSYFHVYETLFSRYVGQRFTFVEIGVLNGGSLNMWRQFFGPGARIVGIDMNPAALRWEDAGFEIFIGDQADPGFWARLKAELGAVDVLLDDGGHTNLQQIVTVAHALPLVRDGGLVVVEDTHTSYFTEFGNPSTHSFMSYAKRLVDHVNSRTPGLPKHEPDWSGEIASIRFFESIVAFEVDRRLCFTPQPTSNRGASVDAKDFRYEAGLAAQLRDWQARLVPTLSKLPLLWRVKLLFPRLFGLLGWVQSRRLGKRYG